MISPRRSRLAGFLLALAGLAAIASAPSARAQADTLTNTAREQMSELVRKAEAREQEKGYCGTLGWPIRGSLDPFYAFLDLGQPGGIYLAKLQTSTVRGCSYYRMGGVFMDQGKKCACTVGWACTEGAGCVVSRATWCRNPDGRWSWGAEQARCGDRPTN